MSDTVLSLQLANAALKKEARALKAEIGKLQTKNAKLHVENVSARLRIKVLEKMKVLPEAKPLDRADLARRVAFILTGGIDERKIAQILTPE